MVLFVYFILFLYKKSQSIKIKSAGIYFGNEHRNSEHEMSVEMDMK